MALKKDPREQLKKLVGSMESIAEKLGMTRQNVTTHLKNAYETGVLEKKFELQLKEAYGVTFKEGKFAITGIAGSKVESIDIKELDIPVIDYKGKMPENMFIPNNAKHVIQGTGKHNLTLVPIRAQAGFLHGYEKRIFDDELKTMNWPFGRGEFWAFEAEGLSMYTDGDESIKPGDYIVTSELPNHEWLKPGKIYVFVTIDGLCIKLFDKIEDDKVYISSANNEFNPVKPLPMKEVKRIFKKEYIIKK